MRVIGLTGGAGSGKSTVSGFLEELGAVILNADKIGHESYRPHSPAWRELQDAFGSAILLPSGEIDRKKLGSLVFDNPGHLAELNRIVHPRIREIAEERLKQLERDGAPVVVLEAALLVDAGWTPLADEVWLTHAPETVVLRRLQKRNGWSEEQARARLHAQLPHQERAKHAQAIIDTDCDLAELRRRVRALWDARIVARERTP